jgi:hypothetical protein
MGSPRRRARNLTIGHALAMVFAPVGHGAFGPAMRREPPIRALPHARPAVRRELAEGPPCEVLLAIHFRLQKGELVWDVAAGTFLSVWCALAPLPVDGPTALQRTA